MTRERDYYKVLQVDPQADADVITAVFRTLARRLHPDRDVTGIDEVRMAELNRAYAVLRDADRRRQYDAERTLDLRAMGPGIPEEPEPERPGGLAARWNAAEERKAAGRPIGSTGAGAGAPGEGDTLLPFGRYAGMSLRQVATRDPDYLRWLGRHSSGLRYRREIERLLKESLEESYSSRPSR
jgi:curved DNA-binding protein CbpA